MSISKAYSLGKSERLKSRKQIGILFESGKKITQFPIRLLYRTEPPDQDPKSELSKLTQGEIKAGFTVSSKNFPRAVDRNRIKRLTREAYRLQKKDLEAEILKTGTVLHLFFIYTGTEIVPYKEISARVNQLLGKLMKLTHECNTSNT
jgi:ribonuclease P protein component